MELLDDFRWLLAIVACTGGCRGLLGIDEPIAIPELADSNPATDGVVHLDGTAITDGTFTNCFGASIVHVCLPNPPTNTIDIASAISTDGASCVASDTPGVCVLAADTITLGFIQRIYVTGTRPLVLIGKTSIDIEGRLDLGSYRGGSIGAGSRATCAGTVAPTGKGRWCRWDLRRTWRAWAARGHRAGRHRRTGVPDHRAARRLLRRAGRRYDTRHRRRGRRRGGHLISAAITIGGGGGIVAFGASGDGGGTNAGGGGGGGGSGGLIGLEAPTITDNSGVLDADGSGGGEGGAGSKGNAGSEPISTSGPGLGGGGANTNGGDGGNGSNGTAVAGVPGALGSTSGGGGGGGAGVIWSRRGDAQQRLDLSAADPALDTIDGRAGGK